MDYTFFNKTMWLERQTHYKLLQVRNTGRDFKKKTLQHSAYYTCHSVMADSECFYVYVLGAVNNFFLSFYTPADRDSYLNTGYIAYLNTHSIVVCLNLPRFSTYNNRYNLKFKQGNVFEHFKWNFWENNSKSFNFYDKRATIKAESNNPQMKRCGSVALQISQLLSRNDDNRVFVRGISGERMIFKFSRYLINGSWSALKMGR
jgi:hypothetical protein